MGMINVDMEKRQGEWFYKCDRLNRPWGKASGSFFMTELMGVSGYYKTEVHIPFGIPGTVIQEILVTCNDQEIVSVKQIVTDRETGKVYSSIDATKFNYMAHYH